MIRKLVYTTLCLFGMSTFALAQSSEDILNKLSAKSKSYKTISAQYETTLIDKKAGLNETQTGSIVIKGKKYALDISSYKVISDEVNMWTYDKETNYCSVELIEDLDEDMMDPTKLFTIWEDDFKHELKNTTGNIHQINLYPLDPSQESFHTIEMYVDKSKMEVKKIVVKGRDGADTVYSIKSFKVDVPLSDSEFNFNESDYPGVDFDDLR